MKYSERSGSIREGLLGPGILIFVSETDDQLGWNQVKKFWEISFLSISSFAELLVKFLLFYLGS